MKQFKTVSEQIAILKSRGMVVGDDASVVLLRENYYSIVNGYKNPFLDKTAMQSSADDIYLPGTEFDWLYGLFRFDRELRQITFSYLIQAEAALKTATVYAFCERHQSCSDYLDRSSFCKAGDMLTPRAFKGNRTAQHASSMNTLMKILNEKLVVKPSSRPFVVHYVKEYGEVPLWVLANDLTFGNMSHFFQLMKRGDQNSVCKYLYQTTFRKGKRITPHEVLRAYNVLSAFRNLCAHDERLYCARVGNDTYGTMLRLLEIALPKDVVENLKRDVRVLVEKYEAEMGSFPIGDLELQLGVEAAPV